MFLLQSIGAYTSKYVNTPKYIFWCILFEYSKNIILAIFYFLFPFDCEAKGKRKQKQKENGKHATKMKTTMP